MSGVQAGPDLIFVSLIHRALRHDGARLVYATSTLKPADRSGRLAGVHAYYRSYRDQLVAHHTHEDTLFFPALAARVGVEAMHLTELSSQHHALDAVLELIDEAMTAMARPGPDFEANRDAAVGHLRAMVEHLTTHLDLEERTALPLMASEVPGSDYRDLERRARKATPRQQAGFMVPWLVEHASPEQRAALFRSAPPLRVVYRLKRGGYRRLEQALAPAA